MIKNLYATSTCVTNHGTDEYMLASIIEEAGRRFWFIMATIAGAHVTGEAIIDDFGNLVIVKK